MKRLAYILAAALALTACVKEQINHPSEADAPATASIYEPIITVDQETNQVTFSIDATGVIPVWLFYNSKTEDFTDRYAQNGYKKVFASAGDYKVRMQVMNSAGVSPDYVEKTFHINNTIMSFDKYVTFLAGGTTDGMTKTWHIDGTVAAHMSCGESGTDGTNWWSANPGDKEAFGVYEDTMTFGSDYSYVYNPGDDGATYVNIDGVTVSPFVDQKGDATADYNVTVAEQTATYAFDVDGDDLYLTFPANTLFPYIDNDDLWANPRLKILSASRETMELVHDNGSIAWHYIITSKAGTTTFNGYNYTADSNLWKPVDAEDAHSYAFWYAPGWNQIADPELTLSGNEYTLSLPEATSDQWQAQFFIIPNDDVAVSLSSDKTYDFSVIVNTNKSIPGLTLKLTDTTDDGNFLFTERVEAKAGEKNIFYYTNLAGIDADAVKMVFDFGGNEAGTEVSISRITLKDHAIDDGTVLPGNDEPAEPETGAHYDITGSTNLWRSATIEEMFYYYAPGWSQIADPVVTADNWHYTFSLPEATSDQWQAQVAFRTTMSSSADKKYDFCCTVLTSQDVSGVTIKLVQTGDDGVYYCADRHNITANTPYEYKLPDVDGIDMEKISLFFDFGGNPAGTDVEIYDICFQEHQDPQGGSETGGTSFDYNSDKNLWKAADAAHTYSQYYAPNWAQIANPDITNNGSTYSFSCPEATFLQWQNQFFIIPSSDIVLDPEKTYDFQCKVTLSQDVEQVTFKLTGVVDDANFVFTERRDIAAYDEYTFEITDVNQQYATAEAVKMVFDFGGNPANLDVEIKDIILYEHDGGSSGGGNTGGGDDDTRVAGSEDAYYDISGSTNLWQAASPTLEFWFADANWSQIADPDYEVLAGNGLKLTVPAGTGGSLWQGQVKMHTGIPVAHASEYDFYADITIGTDATVTVKLTGEEDDADHDLFYVENLDVVEGSNAVKKPYIFPNADVEKLLLLFDFGRVPAGTEINITNVCFQKHIPASEAPEDEGGENLWANATVTPAYWFADGNWSQIADPQVIFPLDGNGIIVVVPQGVGGSEWQGQVKLQSDIPVSAASLYNFTANIASTTEGVCTVKLTTTEDDGDHELFYDNAVSLSPSAPLAFKKRPVTDKSGVSSNALLIFDFGRMSAGTVVTITDIALRSLGDNPDYEE